MTHAHITSWVVALILFFVALSLQKSGKEKPAKMVQMTLRLFYVLIIITGVQLLFGLTSLPASYILKSLLGIVTIGMLEMILVRRKKGKPTTMFWGLLVVSFLVTIYLGLSLPIGFWVFK